MTYQVKQDGKYKFIEEGEGETLIMLHGLFGAMSNFSGVIEHFKHTHKVVVPLLPLFELDLLHTTVSGLEKFFHKFNLHEWIGSLLSKTVHCTFFSSFCLTFLFPNLDNFLT